MAWTSLRVQEDSTITRAALTQCFAHQQQSQAPSHYLLPAAALMFRPLYSPAVPLYSGDSAGLHVVIFDEIDALCRSRGSSSGGSQVGDSIVNQLLTKIDGVSSVPNVLVIGLTNRKDLLDDALLRPGRLEVHVRGSKGLSDCKQQQQCIAIDKRTHSSRQCAKQCDLTGLSPAGLISELPHSLQMQARSLSLANIPPPPPAPTLTCSDGDRSPGR